jgi:hypothetical protein
MPGLSSSSQWVLEAGSELPMQQVYYFFLGGKQVYDTL